MALVEKALNVSRITPVWGFGDDGKIKEFAAGKLAFVNYRDENGKVSKGACFHPPFTNQIVNVNQTPGGGGYTFTGSPVGTAVAGMAGFQHSVELNHRADAHATCTRTLNTGSVDIGDVVVMHFLVKKEDLTKPIQGSGAAHDYLVVPGSSSADTEVLWEQDLGDGVWYVAARRKLTTTAATFALHRRTSNGYTGKMWFHIFQITKNDPFVPLFAMSAGAATQVAVSYAQQTLQDKYPNRSWSMSVDVMVMDYWNPASTAWASGNGIMTVSDANVTTSRTFFRAQANNVIRLYAYNGTTVAIQDAKWSTTHVPWVRERIKLTAIFKPDQTTYRIRGKDVSAEVDEQGPTAPNVTTAGRNKIYYGVAAAAVNPAAMLMFFAQTDMAAVE